MFFYRIYTNSHLQQFLFLLIILFSKSLYFLRKICATFAQNFVCGLLRNFCAWNAMSFARFCAICFAQIAQNRKYFFCEFLRTKRKEFNAIFFAQNRKYYAKRNFLSKLTKFEIIGTELNNWRFIQLLHTTKLLTKKYA